MAFYAENDICDHLLFNYAHWTMCLVTLEALTYNVINISTELGTYYVDYANGDRIKQKTKFIFFVREYQDFFGFLINIRNTIEQYHDFYVRTCNEIDPNNKEQTIYAYKSDIDHHQLLAAVKELLFYGNRGRLSGFALFKICIRSLYYKKIV